MSDWDVEEIPDSDGLYARFLPQHLDDASDRLQPNFFRAKGGGMSTDWNRYATPRDTRSAPNATNKPATDYGVAELSVARVRAIDGMAVVHTPKPENRAHTDVLGLSKEEVGDVLVTIRRELLVTTVTEIHYRPGASDA